MRAVLLGSAFLLSACAGPRLASVSNAPEPLLDPTPPPAPLQIRPAPVRAGSLDAALKGFAQLAAQSRSLHRPGTPMPEGEAANWMALLRQVAGYVDQPLADTPPREVARTAAFLESELERDGASYGPFDPALADAVAREQSALALRGEALRREERLSASRAPTFRWPLQPVVITSLFGRRLHPLLGKIRAHDGIDLAADEGEPIRAAARGTVLRAGRDGGYGILVELLHADGTRTRYAHLAKALVRAGDTVLEGEQLGRAGTTGLSTGPHLHFELWRRGRARDPLRELGPPSATSSGQTLRSSRDPLPEKNAPRS